MEGGGGCRGGRGTSEKNGKAQRTNRKSMLRLWPVLYERDKEEKGTIKPESGLRRADRPAEPSKWLCLN